MELVIWLTPTLPKLPVTSNDQRLADTSTTSLTVSATGPNEKSTDNRHRWHLHSIGRTISLRRI